MFLFCLFQPLKWTCNSDGFGVNTGKMSVTVRTSKPFGLFTSVEAGDKRLREFVERNYAWQRRKDGGFVYKPDDLAGKRIKAKRSGKRSNYYLAERVELPDCEDLLN